MINLIDGSINNPQENIIWTENKSSAIISLNTHNFREGEVLVVGYELETGKKDIMIALGVSNGIGPKNYRVLEDESTIVVAEVLDHTPDISFYAFNQRYLIVGEDGNLYFTRRYRDPETGEILVENIKAEDRCVIKETATGETWICNPPALINFYDLSTMTTISKVEEASLGGAKVELNSGEDIKKNLYLMSLEEKNWVSDQAFNDNFQVSQRVVKYDSSGNETQSVDPCIVAKAVFYLDIMYSGRRINPDFEPTPLWTKIRTGLYSREVVGNTSTNSLNEVVTATVKGKTGSKMAEGVKSEIDNYAFVSYYPGGNEPSANIISAFGTAYLSPDLKLGEIQITPPLGSYTWFCFPYNLTIPKITQMGINYVSSNKKIIGPIYKNGVHIGSYIAVRSLNPGNGETQTITIS